MYADLRVLSARPSVEEERRAAHRLYGVLDGSEAGSAASWAASARATLGEIAAAGGGPPILVGGTGLYLRTLLDGIAPVPAIEAGVRAEVRALGAAEAWAALAREDPAAAARLNAGDRQRVARALEVVRATGRPLAAWQAAREGGVAGDWAVHAAVLDPGREALAARLEARLDAMLAGGAAGEVEALVARALSPDLPVMKAAGVRPIAAWLAGAATAARARAATLIETRQLAKRQRTWFAGQCGDWPKHASFDLAFWAAAY